MPGSHTPASPTVVPAGIYGADLNARTRLTRRVQRGAYAGFRHDGSRASPTDATSPDNESGSAGPAQEAAARASGTHRSTQSPTGTVAEGEGRKARAETRAETR